MLWLSRAKKTPVAPPPVDPVVDETKRRTHKAANDAKVNADRLNKVFGKNGITLNILTMAGGRHEH